MAGGYRFGRTGGIYGGLGRGLEQGAQNYAAGVKQQQKIAAAARKAEGQAQGALILFKQAHDNGYINDEQYTNLLNMKPEQQAAAIGSVHAAAVAAAEQQNRESVRSMAVSKYNEEWNKREAQRQNALAGPGAGVQMFNGQPYRLDTNTGQYHYAPELVTKPKDQTITVPGPPDENGNPTTVQLPITDPYARQVLERANPKAALFQKTGQTPEDVFDASNRTFGVQATPGGPLIPVKGNTQPTHVQIGDGEPMKISDLFAVQRQLIAAGQAPAGVTQPNIRETPAAAEAAAAAAPSQGGGLNWLQRQFYPGTLSKPAAPPPAAQPVPAANIVPGISAPGGAPVTFAPPPSGAPLTDLTPRDSGSAVDTALASAAATQAAFGGAPALPGLGASMGGAGTPFPATAIPTTFRNVAGAGYVPRAVPVDLTQPQPALPGVMQAMIAGANAPRVAPPTPEQIALMGATPTTGAGSSWGPPPVGTSNPWSLAPLIGEKAAAVVSAIPGVVARNVSVTPLPPPPPAEGTGVPVTPRTAAAPSGAPPVGTTGNLNGQPVQWDGTGWLPLPQQAQAEGQ